MLRKNWDINVRRDASKNLEQLLGSNADEIELKKAALHYQPRKKDTDRLKIIICTPEQQAYAWEYSHQGLILLDGTFVLKEAWTADKPEDAVRQFINERKMSLKNLVNSNINLSAEVQNVLNGGVEFLTYVEKQWAGNLLYSWSVKGRKRAAGILGVPLEKLPTTNNHLEGTNEYLKKNQLQRFQRKGHPL